MRKGRRRHSGWQSRCHRPVFPANPAIPTVGRGTGISPRGRTYVREPVRPAHAAPLPEGQDPAPAVELADHAGLPDLRLALVGVGDASRDGRFNRAAAASRRRTRIGHADRDGSETARTRCQRIAAVLERARRRARGLLRALSPRADPAPLCRDGAKDFDRAHFPFGSALEIVRDEPLKSAPMRRRMSLGRKGAVREKPPIRPGRKPRRISRASAGMAAPARPVAAATASRSWS